MAIYAFPSNYFSTASFDLKRYMARNELAGGLTQVRELAEARWVANFRTGPLFETERAAWRGWWDSLRGGLNYFYAYDPAHAFPTNYRGEPTDTTIRVGNTNWGGTASATVSSSTVLIVSGLPSGTVLVAGDMVELRQGDARGLFRLISGGSGTSMSFAVEPRILTTVFTGGITANFLRPSCIMIPEPESWSYTAEAGQYPGASFKGIQRVF
jgi:hypothetical protein